MGTFIILGFLYLLLTGFAVGITSDNEVKSDWERAQRVYKENPSERAKKYLALCAKDYVKERRILNMIWIWPISLPVVLLWLLLKAPRRLYRYIKNKEGSYAQAKMHMKGNV